VAPQALFLTAAVPPGPMAAFACIGALAVPLVRADKIFPIGTPLWVDLPAFSAAPLPASQIAPRVEELLTAVVTFLRQNTFLRPLQ
jgi:hypothetical protein